MNVGKSVQKAIDDWETNDHQSAMLHACNAVDGTAKKVYPEWSKKENRKRFTNLLRENYPILGPMGAPGIDLANTRFPLRVDKSSPIGNGMDLADVIYCFHRCVHGHGEELPDTFALIADAATASNITRMTASRSYVQLSDRIIFGLLAVAVASPKNKNQKVNDDYCLHFADNELVINEWWGRLDDIVKLFDQYPMPIVKLDFGNWMAESD